MVEWKKMWEVTTWDKKFSGVDKYMQPRVIKYYYYLANQLTDLERKDGDIRILYTTNKEAYAYSNDVDGNISEGEVVTIPWGGNVNIQYYKGKFITADNRIATSNNTDFLSNKFLYYWMLSQKEEIAKLYRGAGIQHPSMLSVLSMSIPIPSLSEQERIVGILDTFTACIDNIKPQIEQRRKQYEHYRNTLLTFNKDDDSVEWKTLGEVAEIGTGSGNTNESLAKGLYPFYTRGQEILRKNEYEYDEQAVVTAGDGVGVGKVIHYVEGKYALHQRAYRFCPKKNLNTKFLFYYMKVTFYKYVCGNAVASSVSSLRKPKLQVYPIPIPSLQEQQRIVSILDTFEASITNLEAQLEQRQKQYEYYREELLTNLS